MTAPRHVLLVRTDHLGDMLFTLPAAQALKQAYPDCRITVLASKANALVAEHHPAVDEVVVDAYEAKGSGLKGLPALVASLRRLQCDAAVVVHPTPRLALAVFLSGIPIRIGSAYRAYSFLFSRRIRQHRREEKNKHEAELNIEMLAPLGVAAHPVTQLHWRVADSEAALVDEFLQQRGLPPRGFVVVHPGNAGSAMNWASSQYAELTRRLSEGGRRVLVTGGPAERVLTAEVAAAGGVDLGGALTLPQLAALLSRASLYIGSATGPTHLAAAVGIPVIALYSPLRSSAPSRWRPLGHDVHVIQPALDIFCPKCLGSACPYFHCMEKHLGVDAVEAMARRILTAA